MSAKIMQDLALRLTADTAELKRGVAEANKSLKSIQGVGNQVTSALKGVAAGMAAAFTAGAIINGIKNTINNLQQMSDRLLDLTEITGANTDTLQEWQYVAKISGVNTETFSNAVEGLTQRMARGTGGGKDFNDALKQLNITIRDSNGELRNGADVTEEAIEKLAAMDNVTQRNTLGAKLFTSAWKDLAPIMGNGVEGIKNIREEAHRLGLVLDEEALVAANNLRMSLVELNSGLDAMRNNLAMAVIPTLNDFITKLNTVFETDGISNWEKVLRLVFGGFYKMIGMNGAADKLLAPFQELAEEKYYRDNPIAKLTKDLEDVNSQINALKEKRSVITSVLKEGETIDDLSPARKASYDFLTNSIEELEPAAQAAREALKNFKEEGKKTNTVLGGGDGVVGIIGELTEQIKGYDKAIKEATTFEAIVYFSELKKEAEATRQEILDTVQAILSLGDNLKQLADWNKSNLPTSISSGVKSNVSIAGLSKPEEEVFDADYITVLQNLNDQLTQAESNMWNIVDVAQIMGDAFGKSFTDAGGALKDLVSGMLQLANSIIMVAIAKQIEAAQGSVQNFLTGGGWGLVAAASGVAALTSLWGSIKLADGGLAYGETLATVGEYGGARSNPEVIAPLDKLKGILADSMGGMNGEVRFEIEGDKLVGILSKYNSKKIYF